jgi:ubiquinone/menaquinone biosynthesis C-methylase UbiE
MSSSAMHDQSKNRFHSMARVYDKMAPLLVPQYHFLQDSIIDFFNLAEPQKMSVVDLGAGSGIFLEKILRNNADATCCWIDSSKDFLEVARQKLAKHINRVEFILAPIESSWELRLNSHPDFIFSMSAIHHLEDLEKQALYRKCYDSLSDMGWFVNVDEMKTCCMDAYESNMRFWADFVESAKTQISDSDLPHYEEWNHHFKKWKKRNIDQMQVPKSKGDDIHASFLTQISWLLSIGFRKVDLLLKYQLWCAVCGQKSN